MNNGDAEICIYINRKITILYIIENDLKKIIITKNLKDK